MQVNPHLCFGGDCEAAFRFYAECMGGRFATRVRWGNSPLAEQVSLEWRSKLLHATLDFGTHILTGADLPPDQYESPRGISVLLSLDNAAEAHRIFEALAESGTVHMPVQETFWSPAFGVLVDRFGIPWEIQCDAAS